MLTKLYLFYQIRKFYKIFGEVLNSHFINKLSDITHDNLYDVLFDINEVIYDCCCDDNTWLEVLYAKIERRCNTY